MTTLRRHGQVLRQVGGDASGKRWDEESLNETSRDKQREMMRQRARQARDGDDAAAG